MDNDENLDKDVFAAEIDIEKNLNAMIDEKVKSEYLFN